MAEDDGNTGVGDEAGEEDGGGEAFGVALELECFFLPVFFQFVELGRCEGEKGDAGGGNEDGTDEKEEEDDAQDGVEGGEGGR